MKNRWKDFLFFSQKDKIGILLLLVLIGISSIFILLINTNSRIDDELLLRQEQLNNEFKVFEQDVEENKIVQSETEDTLLLYTDNNFRPKDKTPRKLISGEVIDLNKATFENLTQIPGIGKVLAQRIVDYRKEIGSFDNTEQLLQIKGITYNKLSKIAPYILIQ